MLKRRKTSIINIRNEKGTSLPILQTLKNKRGYYEQLYANKFDNLCKMENIF